MKKAVVLCLSVAIAWTTWAGELLVKYPLDCGRRNEMGL